MRAPTIAVVCNALDDVTRLQRDIHTDSPAASRKILMLCKALRQTGVRAYVLSLGRGKPNGSGAYFKRTVRRVNGVPVIYAPFSHRPVLSEIASLFGLISPLRRLSRTSNRSVIFYNRMTAYLPTLLVAPILGFRCVLDLEDGEVIDQATSNRSLKTNLRQGLNNIFDYFCRHGALLACSALDKATTIRPTLCYYGTTSTQSSAVRWQQPFITVLMSGTLDESTGAHLLIQAIKQLQETPLPCPLRFEITGKGASMRELEMLAGEAGNVSVIVHGRLSDAKYQDVLDGCEIGLALKPIGGALADTTFPSKVIEFADAGLLVLTTDISDVRKVLNDGAIYLTDNDPAQLASLLRQITENKLYAQACAKLGTAAAFEHCSPEKAGENVAAFILRTH